MNFFTRILLVCLLLNAFLVDARRIKTTQKRKLNNTDKSKQYVSSVSNSTSTSGSKGCGKGGKGGKGSSDGKGGSGRKLSSGGKGSSGSKGSANGDGCGTAGPTVTPTAKPTSSGISNDLDLFGRQLRTEKMQ